MFDIFKQHYPVFGFADGPRAMTGDEIIKMQIEQLLAQQSAYTNLVNATDQQNVFYRLFGLARSVPERPLDERFADFKTRLETALERRKLGKTPS